MLIALTTEVLSVCSFSAIRRRAHMRAANVKPRNGGRSQVTRHVTGADRLSAYVEPTNRAGIERVRV